MSAKLLADPKVAALVEKATAKATKDALSKANKAIANITFPEGVTVRQGHDIKRALKEALAAE